MKALIKRSHFSSEILTQPQFSTESVLKQAAKYLSSSKYAADLAVEVDEEKENPLADLCENGIGQLNITGSLVNKRPVGWGALCSNLTSYEELTEVAEYLAAREDIHTVLMNVSSGGGEAFNAFLSAKNISEILKHKKIIAYVDGISASAAYIYTVIAQEVIAHPDSTIGSIGAVIRLIDESKALDKAGIKPIYITAGGSKVPFDKDGGFSKTFIDKMEAHLIELYDEFAEHVVSFRDMTDKQVRDTNAETFRSNEALKRGLIDKIMSYEEFANYLADISGGEAAGTNQPVALTTDKVVLVAEQLNNNNEEEIEMPVDTEMQAKLAAMEAKFKAQEAKLADFEAKEAAAKLSEITSLVATTSFSNKEGIVATLAKGGEVAVLLSGMIEDNKAALESAEADKAAALAAKEQEAAAKLEAAEKEVSDTKEEVKLIKEEFAAPVGHEGGNATDADAKDDEVKADALELHVKQMIKDGLL